MIQGFTIIYTNTNGRSLILYQYTESNEIKSEVQTDGRTYARNIPLPVTRDMVNVLDVTVFITVNSTAYPWSNSFSIVRCSERTSLITTSKYITVTAQYNRASSCY